MKKVIIGLSVGGLVLVAAAAIFVALEANYKTGMKRLENNEFQSAYKCFNRVGSYKNAKDKKKVAYGLLTIYESIGSEKEMPVKSGIKSIIEGKETVDVYYKTYYEENANTENGYYLENIDNSLFVLYKDTREGHTNASWYASDVLYANGKASVYLEARWRANEYQVGLSEAKKDEYANTGHVGFEEDGAFYNGSGNYFKYGEEVSCYFRPAANNTFEGWYENGVLVSKDNPYVFTMPARDVNLVGISGYMELGTYPQTKVIDETLIAELNTMLPDLPNNDNLNGWTSYSSFYYDNGENMWHYDVDTDEDGKYNYRAVYFTEYRDPSCGCKTVDNVTVYYYYQTINGFSKNNIYWFEYEPLQWKHLDVDGTRVYYTKSVIETHTYSDYYTELISKTDYQGHVGNAYASDYRYSYVRSFINTSFYNQAFDQSDKQAIKAREINGYTDNVSTLSNEDYNSILQTHYERRRLCTEYAACMGGQLSAGKGYHDFWLRDIYSNTGAYSGGSSDPYSMVVNTRIGVVPAIILK